MFRSLRCCCHVFKQAVIDGVNINEPFAPDSILGFLERVDGERVKEFLAGDELAPTGVVVGDRVEAVVPCYWCYLFPIGGCVLFKCCGW